MVKKSKIETPEWVIKGYDSYEEYTKKEGNSKQSEQKFKVKICPKCMSMNVHIVLTGEENNKNQKWECNDCKWVGKEIKEKKLNEEEFMKYLDEKTGG